MIQVGLQCLRQAGKVLRNCSIAFVVSVAPGATLQAVEAQLGNQLAGHASPYLAMHGEDPVHWQQWGKTVLELAASSNKLIFISSGYFSCHWCHVMQRESYRNADIAAYLNEHFIPVKIDRELRPALDAYLIDFVERANGAAGWPLNVFLTPEGYPLLGMTYAPAEQFQVILQRMAETWQTRSQEARQLAEDAGKAILQEQQQQPQELADFDVEQLRQAFVQQAMQYADELEGGFGRQSRFPMVPQLLLLLDYLQNHDDPAVRAFVSLTLEQMRTLGLRDHINGGFFRYTVDPGWHTPHFEKMLYSQALLAQLYLKAARVLQRSEYLDVARDTLDFVLRDMRGAQGGFIASISAVDRQGGEGTGYLWSQTELQQLLTADELQAASGYWGLSGQGDSGQPIRQASMAAVADSLQLTSQQLDSLLKSAKRKLQAVAKTSLMPVDDKELTSWNALLLSSLSIAAVELADDRYLEEARNLRRYLVGQLWDGQELLRARDAGQTIGRAGLEDYAFMAEALHHWSVASKSVEDGQLADVILERAWLRFRTAGGWQAGDEGLLPGMAGQALLMDGPLVAADAVVTGLSLQSGNQLLEQKATSVRQKLAANLHAEPFTHASHIRLLSAGQYPRWTGSE